MSDTNYAKVAAVIRSEVEKYYDAPFGDEDHFIKDMHILSDDLSAITLTLERTLGVKLSKEQYRSVANVRSYAEAIEQHVSGA